MPLRKTLNGGNTVPAMLIEGPPPRPPAADELRDGQNLPMDGSGLSLTLSRRPYQGRSTIRNLLPSGSRNVNIGGT
jgi:hypothetical protein